MTPTKWTSEVLHAICARRLAGEPLVEIAHGLGVDVKTLHAALSKRRARFGLPLLNVPDSNYRWTPQRLAMLRRLWAAGSSATLIAERIGGGISRSAVIGKVHRLKLSRPVKSRPAKGQQRAPVAGKTAIPARVVARPAPKPPPPRYEPSERPEGLVSFADLTLSGCKFPWGDPRQPGFGFCGAHISRGKVYCEVHAAVCYLPSPLRRAQGVIRS